MAETIPRREQMETQELRVSVPEKRLPGKGERLSISHMASATVITSNKDENNYVQLEVRYCGNDFKAEYPLGNKTAPIKPKR